MKTLPTRFAYAAIALASLVWQGCSTEDLIVAPEPGLETAARRPAVSMTEGWTVVASAKVNPGLDETLQGSRYTLQVSHGALASATQISISERDPKIVDVKLDPDGIVFNGPVTLTINYAGTANDPDSPYFSGSSPSVRRFSPASGSWAVVPGSDNPEAKTFTVALSGFSRYAMSDGMGLSDGSPSHKQKMQ